jgi:hypothetical protein
MTTTPQIPAPAHTLADSMLSRHFGRETVNYFSSMELAQDDTYMCNSNTKTCPRLSD